MPFLQDSKALHTTVKHKINLTNILQVKSSSKKERFKFAFKNVVELDLIPCGRGFHRSEAATEKAHLP